MTEHVIEIDAVEKSFGKLKVLKGVTFKIQQGSVTAVLGPNTSGKTTLIKCILGLTMPDKGKIRIDGRHLNGDCSYRGEIGYMPQVGAFPENLTARSIFSLLRELRGNQTADWELLDMFALAGQLDKPLAALSGGTIQKISAVIAFLFQPQLMILDEPTVGLDPVSSIQLKEKILSERDKGKTVLLTSHVLSEVEELADEIVFLLDGQVVFAGSMAQLTNVCGESKLERAIARLMTQSRSATYA